MPRKTNKHMLKIISFSLFILSIILIGFSSTSIAASTTYEPAINKGTVTYTVNQYNKEKWEDTVDRELEPDDFFDGDSDEVGARSRVTIKNLGDYEWDLYDALIFFFDVESFIPDDELNQTETLFLLSFLSKDYVDEMFPEEHDVWEALTVQWDFETEEFEESPDDKTYILPIFKEPKNYRDILDDYNEWALSLNITMISLGIEPFPILDGDDFLWLLIKSGIFTIARPFNNYLTTLIDKLGCDDADVKGNTLILERKGEEDYLIEVTFSDQGIISSLIIKNDDDRVIYEIIQDKTDIIALYVFLGAVIAGLLGTIYLLVKRKKSLIKMRE